MKIKPLLLAGGGGQRLYPLSREDYPKQFISILDNESLINETIHRLSSLWHLEEIIIATNIKYLSVTKKQIKKRFGKTSKYIITEPSKRNTFPSILLSVKYLLENKILNQDDALLVFPVDHIINPKKKFIKYIKKSFELLNNNYWLTFGIKPNFPNTGYGYIETGNKIQTKSGIKSYKIKKFHEKPSYDLAQMYFESGNYYWNSGIYGFKISLFIEELKNYQPEIYKIFINNNYSEIKSNFDSMPDLSIDYAISEKTCRACVVPLDIYWNDLGSFESIYEFVYPKDNDENYFEGNVVHKYSKRSYVKSLTKKLVLCLGTEDIFIVNTKDVLLVMQKNYGQKIKELIDYIKNDKKNRKFLFYNKKNIEN